MSNELERICKKAVMAWFKVVSWHSSVGTEEKHNPDSHYPDQDLNWASPRYKLQVLLLRGVSLVPTILFS